MDAVDRLNQLATRLARVTPVLLNEDEDWDPFYDVLDDVLALDDPDDEMFVIGSVVDHFREHHPGVAQDLVAALLHEFEIESEYHARLTQDGLERGCLLFAIPFVTATGDAVPSVFRRAEDVRVLEDILREAQVLSEVAEFQLVPRVFSLDELYGRTFGEYFRMTRHWGDQLLDDGELDSAGPTCLSTISPGAKALPRANNPFVELHFLVGVLAVRKSDLPDVFPAVTMQEGDEDKEDSAQSEAEWMEEPSDPFEADPEVGVLPDGTDWEEAFCEELMVALELMQPPLAALMPSGFHEDMSSGLELEREVGLQHQFSVAMNNNGLQPEEVLAEQVPARDESGVSHGWLVHLVDASSSEVLEELGWPQFGHEAEEDCATALAMALQGAKVAPDEQFGHMSAPRTLH